MRALASARVGGRGRTASASRRKIHYAQSSYTPPMLDVPPKEGASKVDEAEYLTGKYLTDPI